MSIVRCATCASQWNATLSPMCTQCECQRLIAAPNLITDKHDPNLLPLAYPDYRSCLSHDFVDNMVDFVGYATASGSLFFNTKHETWNHFTPEPLCRIPGSGIHAGNPMPDHALDSLLIADVFGDPHAFAVDQLLVRKQICDGDLFPLWSCPSNDCRNLCVPNEHGCVLHTNPPRAHPVLVAL